MGRKKNYYYLYNLLHPERKKTVYDFRDKLNKSKFCSECGEYKSWDCFTSHKKCKYGLQSKCRECIAVKDKKYYKENKEKINRKVKKWQEDNDYKGVSSEYYKKKYDTDINYRVYKSLQARINISIKNNQGLESSKKLLGCSIKEFRKHLESKFYGGMTWDNYGEVWHIDHEIPCAKFDLTDPHQIAVCFHWSNLQPLLAKENIIKSDSINIF